MVLEIERELKFPRGDKRRVQFQVVDEDGDPLPVEDFDISWVLQDTRTRDTVLDLDSDGVILDVVESSAGKISIVLKTTSTSDLQSTDYREVLQVTDPDGDRTTWVGRIILTEDL